jgi:hypothetical protein
MCLHMAHEAGDSYWRITRKFSSKQPSTSFVASKRANMRSRPMRWYTAGVAVITGAAVATAIEMRSEAEQASRAHVNARETQAYVLKVNRHATDTQAAFVHLIRQYDQALTTAKRTQARMLADLRKARKAARSAKNVNIAPVVYSTSFSAAPGVSAAAGAAPSSGAS